MTGQRPPSGSPERASICALRLLPSNAHALFYKSFINVEEMEVKDKVGIGWYHSFNYGSKTFERKERADCHDTVVLVRRGWQASPDICLSAAGAHNILLAPAVGA